MRLVEPHVVKCCLGNIFGQKEKKKRTRIGVSYREKIENRLNKDGTLIWDLRKQILRIEKPIIIKFSKSRF